MKRLILILFFLTVFFLDLAEAGGEINIIPTPKEISFQGERIALVNTKIVIQSQSPKSVIAAQEINDKIISLGGEPLEVLDDSACKWDIRRYNLILIGEVDKHQHLQGKKDKLNIPEEKQGYVIKFVKENENYLIILSGFDPTGTLYAAVSFRSLITNDGKQISLLKANIRDWPDFKWRDIGFLHEVWRRAGLHREDITGLSYLDVNKEYIDFLLRHKINVVRSFTHHFDPELGKEINQYALDRGIYLHFDVMPFESVGLVEEKKNDPRFQDIRISPRHPRHFVSYSRDDLLREQAERYADLAESLGYKMGYFHSIDTGLFTLNYAEWEFRTEECRERFGDDRAAADANVINIIHRTIKERIPGFRFIFVIYPYSPDTVMIEDFPLNILDVPEEFAAFKRHELMTYFKNLHQLIPKDIVICYREARREEVEKWRALFPGRGAYAYFEFGFRYAPFFATNPRFSKTFYFNNDKDILYHSITGNMIQLSRNPVQILLAVEYAWNTAGPAADYFQYYIDFLHDSTGPPEIMDDFVARACRAIWGAGGKYLEPLMRGNIYMSLAENPEKFLDILRGRIAGTRIELERTGTSSFIAPNITPEELVNAYTLQKQYNALKTARESLGELLNQNAKMMDMNLFGQRFVVHYYKWTSLWEVYARTWMYLFRARELYEQGNIPAGDKAVAAGIKSANAIEDRVNRVLKRVAGKVQMYDGFPCWPPEEGVWGHRNYLLTPARFVERFQGLYLKKAKLKKVEIDEKTAIALKSRVLEAQKITSGIKLDGDLSDAAWGEAKKHGNFIKFDRTEEMSLALDQTKVMILYDSENLYLGIICHKRGENKVVATVKERDKGFWGKETLNDCVDILIDANNDKKTFYQMVVNPLGTQFDMRFALRPDGILKVSDKKWDGKWRAAAYIGENKWTVEIMIPFEDIGVDLKKQNKIGINIARQNVSGEELSSISHFTKSFHEVDKFLVLEFGQ